MHVAQSWLHPTQSQDCACWQYNIKKSVLWGMIGVVWWLQKNKSTIWRFYSLVVLTYKVRLSAI